MVSMSTCTNQVGQDATLAVTTVASTVGGVSLGRTFLYFLISLALACCVVFFAVKKVNVVSVFSVIVLTALFFILFTTMGSNVLGLSLPFATYPNPPHLGLDGVSPSNHLAGRKL